MRQQASFPSDEIGIITKAQGGAEGEGLKELCPGQEESDIVAQDGCVPVVSGLNHITRWDSSWENMPAYVKRWEKRAEDGTDMDSGQGVVQEATEKRSRRRWERTPRGAIQSLQE